MKKNLLELYALVVCFVSMMVFCGYLGSAAYHAAQYLAPSALMLDSYTYDRLISNDAYCSGSGACLDDNRKKISEADITRQREADLRLDLAETKANAFVFLVWALIGLPLSATVFAIHWRLGRKARES